MPVFKELYQRVKTGKECARVLSACGKPNYQQQLTKELAVIGNSEMWQAGKAVSALRPKETGRVIASGTRGVSGRGQN
jgi:ketol-acid reductoisomerase